MPEIISVDDFFKVELRVGKVVEATHPEVSEKLIRLRVSFGDETRTIFTGVRPFGFTYEDFLGKQFLFVTNLAPRKMPTFIETSEGRVREDSQGMILAVDGPDLKPIFIAAEGMPVGSRVR